MTFTEIRDAAHRHIQDRPEDIEMIVHNYAKCLIEIGVPSSIFEACLLELNMRHDMRLGIYNRGGKSRV